MTGKMRVWMVKSAIRPNIVRWPAVIFSPDPGKFFITNRCLPYLEDARNIPSIWSYTGNIIWLETRFSNGIFEWKWGFMGNSPVIKMAFIAFLRRNSWISNYYMEEMQYAKQINCSVAVIYVWGVSDRQKHLFISWNHDCWPKFRRIKSLQGGTL